VWVVDAVAELTRFGGLKRKPVVVDFVPAYVFRTISLKTAKTRYPFVLPLMVPNRLCAVFWTNDSEFFQIEFEMFGGCTLILIVLA